MKIAPIPATGIFLVAMLVPTIPFIIIYGRRVPSATELILGMVLLSAALFWAGARLARRPHTLKSLAFVILLTWSFNYAINGLQKDLLDVVAYADQFIEVISLAFVFLAAWRLAPKTHMSTSNDGNDAPV